MEEQNRLLEMLNDIIEVAKTKHNELTMEEIKSFLNGLPLNDNQFNLVYDYLIANKISIKGYINPKNEFLKPVKTHADQEIGIDSKKDDLKQSDSNPINVEVNQESSIESNNEGNPDDDKAIQKEEDEEKEFLDMYLSDIEAIPEISKEEIEKLVSSYLNEDETAKSKLVEAFLKDVVTIAKEYRNHGITIADLIQEGNIGLMQAISNYKKNEEKLDFSEYITDGIRENITSTILELNNSKSFAKRMAERLTNLNHNITELKEDLGKKPTLKEIADYMEIEIEEVKDMVRMSKEEDLEIDYQGNEL